MKILNKIEDLFRIDGKLNYAILRQPWFQTSDLYKEILKISDQLGATDNSTIAERIFQFQRI